MMPTSRGRTSRTTTSKVERTTTGGTDIVETHESSSSSTRRSRMEASGEAAGGGSTVRTSHYSSSSGSASAGAAASGSSGDAGGTSFRSSVTVTRSSRSRSPLLIRREEEKEEIAGLNDRLAEYIDYVRHLDSLNQELKRKYKSASQVDITADVDKVKGMFENEIASLRRALDVMAKEKAALEVENRKMKAEWEEMKGKLSRKEAELRALERKLEQYQKEMAEARLDRDRYSSLKREYEQEVRQISELKKALEGESAARAEFESKYKNVKKEMDFQTNLYKEEKSKWFTRTVEIEEEVENRAKAEYESLLAVELAAMREQTQEDMRAYRMQIDTFFSAKFAELQTLSETSMSAASKSKDEVHVFRRRLDEVNAELAKKQAEVEGLMRRIGELEKLLEEERRDFESQARMYREQNASLRAEMEKRFKEFNDLMAIKVALDQEILAYRKLLESEETRCKLSHSGRTVTTRTVRSSKQASSHGQHSVDVDEEDLADVELASISSHGSAEFGIKTSSSGPIEFVGCDGAGQFVTIKNSSNSDVVVGGWQLRYVADEKETLYKFPRNLTVKAGESCTVWSSESHTTHDPPHNLVMKGLTFFTGTKVQVFLLHKENEMAVCEIMQGEHRRTSGTAYTTATRRTYATATYGTEEGGAVSQEERCSIM